MEGKANADAVRGVDLAVLATKSGAALDFRARPCRRDRRNAGHAVASDLRFGANGVLPGRLGASLAEEVAEIVAEAGCRRPADAGSRTLTQKEPPDQDALICGDDTEAKRISLEVAAQLVASRAIDAGPLENARALEGLTAVILNVNKRYRAHAGVRLTGLE